MNKICAKCGQTFNAPNSRRKYCSWNCYQYSGAKGRHHAQVKGYCLQCNTPLIGRPSRKDKFCSTKCYGEYWQGREKPARQRRIKLPCKQCGKEYKSGGRIGVRKCFCSLECYSKYNQVNLRKTTGGEAWIRFAKQIKERDGKCVMCGKLEGLQAHHVIPKTWKGHPNGFKGEEKPEDLITLCIRCHNIIDGANTLGYQHNPNFNPWQLVNLLRNQ